MSVSRALCQSLTVSRPGESLERSSCATKDGFEIIHIPPCLFTAVFKAGGWFGDGDRVKRGMAHNGHVGRCSAAAQACEILRNTTSRTQCRRFSIPQWPRTTSPNISALRRRPRLTTSAVGWVSSCVTHHSRHEAGGAWRKAVGYARAYPPYNRSCYFWATPYRTVQMLSCGLARSAKASRRRSAAVIHSR